MRIAKNDVPVRVEVPGAAVARQISEFGDASGFGTISGEYFSLAAGTDIKPLLAGLKDDLCQAPHWGYLIEGSVWVNYIDGTEEVINSGDLFFWPAGHTVRVEQNAEIILFSPRHEHDKTLDQMNSNLGH